MSLAIAHNLAGGIMTTSVGPPQTGVVRQQAPTPVYSLASASPAITLANAQVGGLGDAIVLTVVTTAAGSITSVTDSSGNTYNNIIGSASATYAITIYVALNVAPAAAGANTITVNLAAGVSTILSAVEYSGVGAVDTNITSGTANTAADPTCTLSSQYPCEMVVAAAVADNNTAPTPGTGFATAATLNNAALGYVLVEDQLVLNTISSATSPGTSVTCATATAAVSTWSILAIGLVALNCPTTSDGTYCFFYNQTTAEASCTFLQVLNGNAGGGDDGIRLTANAAGTILQLNIAGGGILLTGPTLGTGVWWFICVRCLTVAGTSRFDLIYKRLGGTLRITSGTISNSYPFVPTGIIIGAGYAISGTNVLNGSGAGSKGSYAGFKFFPGIWMSLEEIDRESEQIELRRRGDQASLSFEMKGITDLTSQTGFGSQLSFPDSGPLSVSGPPIREYDPPPRRVRKKASAVAAVLTSQSYPERVPGPARHPAYFMDVGARGLAPERQQVYIDQDFPEALRGLPRQHMHALDVAPLPLPSLATPVKGYTSFPDRVPGQLPRQQTTEAMGLVPEHTSPLVSSSYPDLVDLRRVRAYQTEAQPFDDFLIEPLWWNAPWTPLLLGSALTLFLDPEVGFVPNTSWTDQAQGIVFTYTSGSGSTATAGTGINGTPSVDLTTGGRFSSTSTLGAIISNAAGHGYTIASTWKYTGSTGEQLTPYMNACILADTAQAIWQSISVSDFHNGLFSSGVADDARPVLGGAVYYSRSQYDGAGAVLQTSFWGAPYDSPVLSNEPAAVFGTLVVGSNPAGTVTFVGSYGPLIVINRVLTAQEQGYLDAWMSWRTQTPLAGNLSPSPQPLYPVFSAAPPASFPDSIYPQRMLGMTTLHPAYMLDALAIPPAQSAPAAPQLTSQSYPERIPGPLARAQLAVAAINEAPERTLPLAAQWYPETALLALPRQHADWAARNLATERTADAPVAADYPAQVLPPLPRQSLHVAAVTVAPERTAPLATQSYPERVPGALPRAYVDVAPRNVAPDRTNVLASQSYPDAVPGPQLRAFVFWAALNAAPERTLPMAAADYPPQVLGLPRSHLFALDVAPLPLPTVTVPAYFSEIYPERVPAAAPVAFQQIWSGPLAPERALPMWSASFPDRQDPPLPRQALYWTEAPAHPERTSVSFGLSYPDAAPGPLPRYPLAVAAMPLAPERVAPLASADFPARLDGPLPRQQGAFEVPPRPERTLPYFPEVYPEAVPAALPRAPMHVDAGPLAPERTSSYVTASYPDWLPPPRFRPYDHEQPAKPEALLPRDWHTAYPEHVSGPLQPQHLHALDVGPFPLPSLAAPAEGYASYPDLITRVPVHGWQFLQWTENPPLVIPTPIFPTHYPAAVPGPLPRQQTTEAIGLAPERTLPLFGIEYPSTVPGAQPRQHVDSLAISPAPERTLSTFGLAYPERVPGPAPRQAPPWASINLAPERVAPMAAQDYPATVRGAALPTSQQQAWQSPDPYLVPLLTAPIVGYSAYPDTVPGPLPRQQMAAAVLNLRPERTLPLAAQSFPDTVPGPLPRQQLPVASLPARPERTLPTAAQWYPDAVPGPIPRQHTDQLGIAPEPERTTPSFGLDYPATVIAAAPRQAVYWATRNVAPERIAPLAAQDYPPTVRGVAFPSSQQQAWESPLPFLVPITTAPIEAYWSYPDAVPGPLPRQQMAVVSINLRPERTSPLASSSYPDRVDPPLPRQQLPVATLNERPERTSPSFGLDYPASILPALPRQHTDHLAIEPEPERRAAQAAQIYPDAVPGPLPRQSIHVAALPVAPEARLPYFADSYPERVPGPLPRQQWPTSEEPPRPERTAPVGYTAYPDNVPGPLPRQFFYSVAIAPEPERKYPYFGDDYPSRIDPPKPRQQWPTLSVVVLPQAVPAFAYQSFYADRVPGPRWPAVTDWWSPYIDALPAVIQARYLDLAILVFGPSLAKARIPTGTTVSRQRPGAQEIIFLLPPLRALASWSSSDPPPKGAASPAANPAILSTPAIICLGSWSSSDPPPKGAASPAANPAILSTPAIICLGSWSLS